jgi:pyruvate dehydrogenase E2 component (dihydrolipoamide acetyltransferase)
MAVEIVMPAMEMAQDSARLVAWLRDEGEYIRQGEPVMEIETDKVTVEIEAPGSGVLSRIAAQPGDEVAVGAVVAYLLEEGEQAPAEINVARDSVPASHRSATWHRTSDRVVGEGGDGAPTPSRERSPALRTARYPNGIAAGGVTPRVWPASPKARRLAAERGVDLGAIAGSGPNGAVLAADVTASGYAVPRIDLPVQADYTAVPIAGMRRTIADRVQASYRIAPHISLTLPIDMTEALRRFERRKAELRDEQGVHLTVTALLAFVLSRVLRDHPRLNAHLVSDEIRESHAVNLGVAVDIEDGLIVPVIHRADQKRLVEIQVELDRLVARAREGSLTREDVSGGTFTLSNLGMFGIQRFTAIVNPPQVGILSAGAIEKTPVGWNDQIVLRPIMHLTVNVDHRAVDGAVAARFLQRLKVTFGTPSIVLV